MRLRERWAGRKLDRGSIRDMNPNTSITDATLEAFLHCETKAYLLDEHASGAQSELGAGQQGPTHRFKQSVSDWLRSTVREEELYVGTPSPAMLEEGSHRIVLRPLMESQELRAEPDALWRIRPASDSSLFLYSPVRFVRN